MYAWEQNSCLLAVSLSIVFVATRLQYGKGVSRGGGVEGKVHVNTNYT